MSVWEEDENTLVGRSINGVKSENRSKKQH